jgi:hypothetical protein
MRLTGSAWQQSSVSASALIAEGGSISRATTSQTNQASAASDFIVSFRVDRPTAVQLEFEIFDPGWMRTESHFGPMEIAGDASFSLVGMDLERSVPALGGFYTSDPNHVQPDRHLLRGPVVGSEEIVLAPGDYTLTAASQISIAGFREGGVETTYSVRLLAMQVPEPATWLVAAISLFALWHSRRHR